MVDCCWALGDENGGSPFSRGWDRAPRLFRLRAPNPRIPGASLCLRLHETSGTFVPKRRGLVSHLASNATGPMITDAPTTLVYPISVSFSLGDPPGARTPNLRIKSWARRFRTILSTSPEGPEQ